MNESTMSCLTGQIVDEDVEFTFVELCRITGASEDELILWVSEGIFDPNGNEPQNWRFSGASLRRVWTARRLARDLQINPPGIAMILDLLDEIEVLRTHSRRPPPL